MLVVGVAGIAGGVIWVRKPANVTKMNQFQQRTKTKLATLTKQYTLNKQYKNRRGYKRDSVTLKPPMIDKMKMKIYPKLIDPIPSTMRPMIDQHQLEGHVYSFAAGNIAILILKLLRPVILIICFFSTPMFIYTTEKMYSRDTPLLKSIYPFAKDKVNNFYDQGH